MKVVCVLRSGGDYTPRYAIALQRGVKKHLRLDHRFICLTDDCEWAADMTLAKIETRPLLYDWPGWWAKINAFAIGGPCLYLDLDTVLTGDISDLCASIYELKEHELLTLRCFRVPRVASGVMAWRGDWSWLVSQMRNTPDKQFQKIGRSTPLVVNHRKYRGDQDWIADQLAARKIGPLFLQSRWPHIASYKHHCRRELPQGTRLVCFHGEPRPHEIDPKPVWMKEYWA